MNIFAQPDIDLFGIENAFLSVAREERTERTVASGEKIDFEICNLWFGQFSCGGAIIGLEYSCSRATDPTYTIHINVWQRKIWNGKCCKQTRLDIELNSVFETVSVQCLQNLQIHFGIKFYLIQLPVHIFHFSKNACITSHENCLKTVWIGDGKKSYNIKIAF